MAKEKPAMKAARARAEKIRTGKPYIQRPCDTEGEGTWLVIEGGDIYPHDNEIDALRRVNQLAQDATKLPATAWFVRKGSSLWKAQGY